MPGLVDASGRPLSSAPAPEEQAEPQAAGPPPEVVQHARPPIPKWHSVEIMVGAGSKAAILFDQQGVLVVAIKAMYEAVWPGSKEMRQVCQAAAAAGKVIETPINDGGALSFRNSQFGPPLGDHPFVPDPSDPQNLKKCLACQVEPQERWILLTERVGEEPVMTLFKIGDEAALAAMRAEAAADPMNVSIQTDRRFLRIMPDGSIPGYERLKSEDQDAEPSGPDGAGAGREAPVGESGAEPAL